jgi:hypothetical protein
MSLLSASVSSAEPTGGSTTTHVGGRKTYCREQRGQTTGAAARKRTAALAIPTFQPIRRLVERRVIGEIISSKIESSTNFNHVVQPTRHFTVAVAVFEPKKWRTT